VKFDIPTLSILVAVSALVFAFACVTVASLISSERHLQYWAWGASLCAVSTVLVGLRGTIPLLISAALANTMLAFGFTLVFLGTRGLLRRPMPGRWVWGFTVFAALALFWFVAIHPSLAARVVVVSLVMGPLLTLITAEFWRHDRSLGPTPLRKANRITMAVTGAGALLFYLRIIPALDGSMESSNYLASTSPLIAAPYLWAILFNTWLSIAVTLTVSAHLLADLVIARDQAQANSVAKSQFLANMSHEIRTPMNAVLGMLHLLRNTDLSAQQSDYAQKSEGAARSLLGLLNDVLDFSKVEAGKMTLDPRAFSVDQLLRELAVVLCANVGTKTIEVLYDVDAAIPAVVVGDSMRLQQVLVNLGGNAVKFTAQGQVVVSVRVVRQDAQAVVLEFSVRDTGIGIAPESQGHIFSGFSQADSSTSRTFGGTGLGLTISKKLVQLMGGDITLTSTQGIGSEFTFALPFTLTQELPPELQSLPSLPSEARKTLVVDDSAIAANLTAAMARSWGWPTDIADDGEKALRRVQALTESDGEPYTVIYMDWQMPGIDGWETARQIRDWYRAHSIAQPTIVMVSANQRESVSDRTQEEQNLLDAYLGKPFTAAMLREASLHLDAAHSRLQKAKLRGSRARRLSGMRVLVVEDNLINQQVAEELLMSEGALVSLAANGRLGVDAVASAQPQFDAVLMDIQMPVMDGYAATRAIRNDLGLGALPIIAMTANAMASDRAECLQAGMDEHVGKPFELPRLVRVLMQLTGRDAAPTDPAPLVADDGVPFVDSQHGDIDVAGALARMSGMTDLYLSAAREFEKSLPLVASDFAAAAHADMRQAMMQMHTLKGTAALIGAVHLSRAAAVLEKTCRDAPETVLHPEQTAALHSAVQSTQQALAQALDALEAQLLPPVATAPGSGSGVAADVQDPAALQDALAALVPLLAASDLHALEVFATLRPRFDVLPQAELAALEAALQRLDLQAALRVCQAAQRSLQEAL